MTSSGVLSAMAPRCPAMPAWFGRAYAGVVARTPATPVAFTWAVSATDCWVLANVEPASTGTVTASATQAKRLSFSSSLRDDPSPVEPATTSPSLPLATRNLANFCATSKSIEPSDKKGVTMAVRRRTRRGALMGQSYQSTPDREKDAIGRESKDQRGDAIEESRRSVNRVGGQRDTVDETLSIKRVVANGQSLTRRAKEYLLVGDESGQSHRVNLDPVPDVGTPRAVNRLSLSWIDERLLSCTLSSVGDTGRGRDRGSRRRVDFPIVM